MKPLGHSAYVKAWLVYALGGTLLSMFICALIGLFLGTVLKFAGVAPRNITIASILVGLAFSIPFSYFMFWASVKAFIVDRLQDEKPQAP